MKNRGRRRKGLVAGTAMALSAFLITAILFKLVFGGVDRKSLPETHLGKTPSQTAEVLLLEERDGMVWLICGDGESTLSLRLDAATGEVLSRREENFPVYGAALRGQYLYVWEDLDSGCALCAWDTSTLGEVSRLELGEKLDSLALYDVDASGNAIFVTASERRVLKVWEPGGVRREITLSHPIQALAGEPGGDFLVYAGNSLCTPLQPELEAPCQAAPRFLLGDGKFVDEDGVVCSLTKDGVRSLFQCGEAAFASAFCCLGGENCLILSAGGGAIHRYDLAGNLLDNCEIASPPAGLCPSGAVCIRDGELYYVPLNFSALPAPSVQPSVSPSAQPSVSPSVSPSPSASLVPEDRPVRAEGDWLIISQGVTVAEVRRLMEPEEAEIRDAAGIKVSSGRMATGMTVNQWTVVVPGDCNGTGTVTEADLRRAASMILGSVEGTSAQYRAGDLNEDGVLSTADLVLINAVAFAEP